MLQKYKHGNISLLMMVCVAIMLASSVMLLNISQRYKEQQVLVNSYQEDLTNASTYEVIAEGIIGELNGIELRQGTPIWTQPNLESIQLKVKGLLGREVELEGPNPPVETTNTILLTCNTYTISITNIAKPIRVELEEIGVDSEGNPIYQEVHFYTLDLSNSDIKIERIQE